jgi:uroporphyrinogen decarboxylase
VSRTLPGNGSYRLIKPLLQAFDRHSSDRPPFWYMRQAGRYLPEYRRIRESTPDFLTFCYTPELCVEAALQPLRRYHMDAAILFSDILVVPDALGCRVAFVEGQGPVLEPVRSATEVAGLSIERLEVHLQPVFEAVHLLSQAIPVETAMIGFAGAPWTVAVYMVEGRGGTDCETARSWAYRDPEAFGILIDLLVEATVVHLRRQIENGAEVVQLFDSWAGVLAESQFRSWVIRPTAEIVRRLKSDHPEIRIIGFPRNAGVRYLEYVKETGIDGVSIDATVPLDWAVGSLQEHCLVQGNLDNQALVVGGEVVEEETMRILETLGDGPFIFNLGHGILPQTPPENVARISELIRGREKF